MCDKGERRDRKPNSYQGVGVPHYPGFQSVLNSKHGMTEAPKDNRGLPRRIRDPLKPPHPKMNSLGNETSITPNIFEPPPLSQEQPTKRLNEDPCQYDYSIHLTEKRATDSDQMGYTRGHFNPSQPGSLSTSTKSTTSTIRSSYTTFEMGSADWTNEIMDVVETSRQSNNKRILSHNVEIPESDEFWSIFRTAQMDLAGAGAQFLDVPDHVTLSTVPPKISASDSLQGITDVVNVWHAANSKSFGLVLAFTYLAKVVVRSLRSARPTTARTEDLFQMLGRYHRIVNECDMREREVWRNFAIMRDDSADETQAIHARMEAHLRDKRLIDTMQLIFANGVSSKSSVGCNSNALTPTFRYDIQDALLFREFTLLERSKVVLDPHPQSTMIGSLRHLWQWPHHRYHDTKVPLELLFISLTYFESFLSASQHPETPQDLRSLAQKYQMPKRIWAENMKVLLERVEKEDSTQHMLYWLQYGYDYVQNLRKVAPDLELDWMECEKGLDMYHIELERRCSHEKASDPVMSPGRRNSDLVMSASNFDQQQDLFPGDVLVDEEIFRHINVDNVSTDLDPDEHMADTLLELSWNTGQPVADWAIGTSNENNQSTINQASLQQAMKELSLLNSSDLKHLHDFVLQVWDLLGQDVQFGIYVKVHGILSRCGPWKRSEN